MKISLLNTSFKQIKRVIIFILNKRKTKLVNKMFDANKLQSYIQHNRKSLSKIKKWINEDIYNNSLYHYGLPEDVKPLIDKQVGDTISYSDLLIYLSQNLSRISYLELGVSVGKNFWQMINYFNKSKLVGLDIEEINPVLESFFNKKNCIKWKTQKGSIKTKDSSLTNYVYNDNLISYISADVFDKNTGSHIPNNRFTVLFSDAFHSSTALRKEWEMIKRYDLLDKNEFILMWDDLVGDEMNNAFEEIWREVKVQHGLSNRNRLRVLTNGWIGQTAHEIGIITKFKNI